MHLVSALVPRLLVADIEHVYPVRNSEVSVANIQVSMIIKNTKYSAQLYSMMCK